MHPCTHAPTHPRIRAHTHSRTHALAHPYARALTGQSYPALARTRARHGTMFSFSTTPLRQEANSNVKTRVITLDFASVPFADLVDALHKGTADLDICVVVNNAGTLLRAALC